MREREFEKRGKKTIRHNCSFRNRKDILSKDELARNKLFIWKEI